MKAGSRPDYPANFNRPFLKGREKPACRSHSDPLFRISYGIFSVKFVIVELVFSALGLYGLYKFVQSETGFSLSTFHPAEISAPAHSRSSPASKVTPVVPNPGSNAATSP